MKNLVERLIFTRDLKIQEKIKKTVQKKGIFLASTHSLYEKMANGEISGFTVPAFNLRTLTFDAARALFRAAKKEKSGAFIVELAKSEMEYTSQTPEEYSICILAAAIEEKFKGPVFLQGDHFKLVKKEYLQDKEKAVKGLENLIKRAVASGFYNIDIDCSVLDLTDNVKQTAYFTHFIRGLPAEKFTFSVGGEVGEIGGKNTTVEEVADFMAGYQKLLKEQRIDKGLIKLAVQTGTSHGKGGVIDWPLLKALAQKAKEYGLAGIVQHGASKLAQEQFQKFPKSGVCEIHLATEFQDIILNSEYFPGALKQKIKSKQDLGIFKKEIWGMPQKNIDKICEELEAKFIFFFRTLKINGTGGLLQSIYQ